MSNGGDAAAAGVSYSGVSLVGEAGGQLRTVDGLTLKVDATGVTITGPSPDRVNSVPWDSVLGIAPGESDAFPDGRPATVVGLSLPGRTVRLLVPAEQLTPAQVAAFVTHRPGDTAAPAGPDTAASAAPATAPGTDPLGAAAAAVAATMPAAAAPAAAGPVFTTEQINQLLSAARPSAPAPAAPPPPPGSLPPGYAPAPGVVSAPPAPGPLPAGYAQPPLPAGYAPLPAGYAQPPRPSAPTQAATPAGLAQLQPGSVLQPGRGGRGPSDGGRRGRRNLFLGIAAVVVVVIIVVGAVIGLSSSNKQAASTSSTTSTTRAPIISPHTATTVQPPSDLQGPALIANTGKLAPEVNITARQLPPHWSLSLDGYGAGPLPLQDATYEKSLSDAQTTMASCVNLQPSHLQLLFQDFVPGGPPAYISNEYSPFNSASVASNNNPGDIQLTDAFSEVSFPSDANTERADMAVMTSPGFLNCFIAFERALTSYEFSLQGGAVDGVTATVVATHLHPGVQAVAFEFHNQVVVGGINFPIETFFLLAGAGRLEGYLQVDSGPAPFPITTWQDIVNVFEGRLAKVASPGVAPKKTVKK